MKKNTVDTNIKNKQKGYYGKKVSTNEKLLVDYLNGDITEGESNHYSIRNNIVFGKSQVAEIFLFYKEDDNIFYRFAENNRKFTKLVLALIPKDKYTLYLLDRQIMIKKVRKNIFERLDTFDMIHTIISIYVNEDYYQIINNTGYDFLEILFRQVKAFDCEDELFSKKMTDIIGNITKDKKHPDYGFSYGIKVIPTIPTPSVYLDLRPKNLKRAYKINCLIS